MPLKPWDQRWHTVTHISLAKGSHMAEHKVTGQLKLPPPLAGGQQRGKGHVLGVGWVGCRTGASEAPANPLEWIKVLWSIVYTTVESHSCSGAVTLCKFNYLTSEKLKEKWQCK